MTLLLPSITYADVTTVSDTVKTAWGYSVDNSKTFITDKYSIKNNTQYDFQYVKISTAVNIYEHGARFCNIELQHNWDKWKIFIDPKSCKTVCMDGYYGDSCSTTTPSGSSCDFTVLSGLFNPNATSSGSQEQNINGFYTATNDSILLQITSSTDHSITVQPIEFYGNNQNDIGSVNTRGNSIVLCAAGYAKDANGKCQKTSACNCPANQAHTSETDATCIECGQTPQSGIDKDGICKICDSESIFDSQENKCVKATIVTPNQMQPCFKIIATNEFKKCVLGEK